MSRVCCLFMLAAAVALGQIGRSDPEFDTIPFEEWRAAGGNAHLQWSLRVFPPLLEDHQRFGTKIVAVVNADEFSKRPRAGQMQFFLEIRDHDDIRYQTHRTLRLAKTTNPADLKELRLIEPVCFIPGDYDISAAVYDTDSKQHNFKEIKLHVPDIAHDPFRNAWQGLPSAESYMCKTPFSLPLDTERSVKIEVIANSTLDRDRKTGASTYVPLLSRLQVISQLQIRNGSMYLTVLDLEHRKVRFAGEAANPNARRRLAAAMSTGNPRMIDASGVAGYNDDAQFFVSQVRRRLESAAPAEADRVLIILTARLTFPKGVDLRPIQTADLASARVFYIRCSPLYLRNSDALEATLKPLNPRLFDVTTAMDFRNALAAIMSEVAKEK